MLLELKTPRRYLVTGGCGFIGSHLVDALIARRQEVVILDNLSTGKRENAHPHATLIVGDATNYDTVARALKNVQGCFHLAAVASVQQSVTDWARTHAANLTSTVNIFDAVSKRQPRIPVVYASSAAVYGDCAAVPISEDTPPSPLTAYGADKLGCDLHARVARHVHGIPTTGLRPFNVYGPRQDPSSPYSGVISIFADRLHRGLPITIYGDGEQQRDFVYVEDAVKAFLAAMTRLERAKEAPAHEVINLCTGHGTTINQLADTIGRIAGCALPRNYTSARAGDIRLSVGHPGRLSQQLGLTLGISLEDGLRGLLKSMEPEVRRLHS